jgi:hypothetical protein
MYRLDWNQELNAFNEKRCKEELCSIELKAS